MFNSYGNQVNPHWTREDITNSKIASLRAKEYKILEDISNCNWFLNHPKCTEQQTESFKNELATLETQLLDIRNQLTNI